MSVSIPEKREIPFEDKKENFYRGLSIPVSIPEKREIPFEAYADDKLKDVTKVSIPEKREIPFEDVKELLRNAIRKLSFNP